MGRKILAADRARRYRLSGEPEPIARLVRILAAAGNVAILRALAEARRKDRDGGWMFLSEIAEAVGEAPGSVGLAVEKLRPLLEERRHKGRRWFRSRILEVTLVLDELEPEQTF